MIFTFITRLYAVVKWKVYLVYRSIRQWVQTKSILSFPFWKKYFYISSQALVSIPLVPFTTKITPKMNYGARYRREKLLRKIMKINPVLVKKTSNKSHYLKFNNDAPTTVMKIYNRTRNHLTIWCSLQFPFLINVSFTGFINPKYSFSAECKPWRLYYRQIRTELVLWVSIYIGTRK